MTIIQSLWVGSPLSGQEILSIRSFLANGHDYHLYVYDDVGPVPAGVVVRNAEEILGREHAVRDNFGSFAFLADKFRYKLLLNCGGIWVDTDVICVRPFDFEDDYFFCGETLGVVSNTVIKAPAGAPVMATVASHAVAVKTHVSWGYIGANLLTRALEHPAFQSLQRFIRPPEAIFPIHHTRWQDIFFKEYEDVAAVIPATTYGIHLSNQMIRWTREAAKEADWTLDPDRPFPPNTIFGYYQRRYL